MVWHAECSKLLLRTRRDVLAALVEACLGAALQAPVIFEPILALTSKSIRAWLVALARCVRAAERCRASGASNYRFQQVIEEDLTLGLVQAQPGSISHFPESPCARTAQATHVRRARASFTTRLPNPFACMN